MSTALELKPISALDAIEQAYGELSMVVLYGLAGIKDDIDREHVVKAHQLLELTLKAQRGEAA